MVDVVRAIYRIRADESVEERAKALALEQTAELPADALVGEAARKGLVGRVVAVERDPEAGHQVTIEYPAAAAADDPAQLLNLLFGNASQQDDVELLDAQLPDTLRELLGGPGHGIQGIRSAVGAGDRPLACAALKPMGLGPEALGRICSTLAEAGIDVIKDDHGLADAGYCPLEARMEACLSAVERVSDATGRRAVYAPNLIGSPAALARQLETAERLGAGAVLVAPLVVGLPAFHELAQQSPVPIVAHPALSGGSRIATPLLLGTLFRLYGADAVVFPHAGGRFPFDETLCRDLADRLRRPGEGIRPALPVPAGGISVERVREMIGFYGSEVMLLVGGTLYRAGELLGERAREFVERVRGGPDAVETSGEAVRRPRERRSGAGR
ncbi:MAG: RuBisCO large subunit C-terminal-like domain-containing protein [Gemmatimonadota bacterium]